MAYEWGTGDASAIMFPGTGRTRINRVGIPGPKQQNANSLMGIRHTNGAWELPARRTNGSQSITPNHMTNTTQRFVTQVSAWRWTAG